MIYLLLLLLSYMLNACADAIDHAKSWNVLYEVWHIFKAASYAIPFTIILHLLHVDWKVYILFWIALWIYWEMVYRLARYFELYRLDNKLRIKWLYRLWRSLNW